jgi:hypothetical protein
MTFLFINQVFHCFNLFQKHIYFFIYIFNNSFKTDISSFMPKQYVIDKKYLHTKQ